MTVRSRRRTSAFGRKLTLPKLKFISHCSFGEVPITMKVATTLRWLVSAKVVETSDRWRGRPSVLRSKEIAPDYLVLPRYLIEPAFGLGEVLEHLIFSP
ncbi:MAG: hypothetical protein MRJ68_11490 [Nitrospira sp.]|nr:hypothetical protein [Nitrospira sp.]